MARARPVEVLHPERERHVLDHPPGARRAEALLHAFVVHVVAVDDAGEEEAAVVGEAAWLEQVLVWEAAWLEQ
eukprot:1452325-Rhodomonas_salina.1